MAITGSREANHIEHEAFDGEINKSFDLYNREGNAVGGQVRLILTYFPDKRNRRELGRTGKVRFRISGTSNIRGRERRGEEDSSLIRKNRKTNRGGGGGKANILMVALFPSASRCS